MIIFGYVLSFSKFRHKFLFKLKELVMNDIYKVNVDGCPSIEGCPSIDSCPSIEGCPS